MKWQGLLAALLFLAAGLSASAQVLQLSAQTQRTYFLLYERVDVIVTLTNIGGTELELNNDEGRPWLGFQVSGESVRNNFLPVHSERQSNFAPLMLKANETKTLRINITPLFSFRSEGNYRVSAIIDLPGEGQVVSDPVPFAIQRGRVVSSNVRSVDSLERVYSLVRFSPSSEKTNLYLRVEAPSENVVYSNYALGEMVSSVDPSMMFDPEGNVHVLQPSALGTYLYSRTDEDGKIINQRIFKTIQWQGRPHLAKLDDGSVVVEGGLAQSTAPVEKLSDTQQGSRMTAPAAPASTPPPTAPPPTGP